MFIHGYKHTSSMIVHCDEPSKFIQSQQNHKYNCTLLTRYWGGLMGKKSLYCLDGNQMTPRLVDSILICSSQQIKLSQTRTLEAFRSCR